VPPPLSISSPTLLISSQTQLLHYLFHFVTLLLLISFFSSLFPPVPFHHHQPPFEKRPPWKTRFASAMLWWQIGKPQPVSAMVLPWPKFDNIVYVMSCICELMLWARLYVFFAILLSNRASTSLYLKFDMK